MSTRLAEIRALTHTRFMLFLREPEAVFWVFVFPLVMAMVLGLAFREQGVTSEKIAVLGEIEDESLEQALLHAEHLEVQQLADPEEASYELRSGKVSALLVPGEPLTLRFDPNRPEGEIARLRVEEAIQRAAGRTDPVVIRRDEVEETGSRYIDWLIPGLLGMNIMGTGIWSIGFGVVDARQKKLLKRLLVTPMRRSSYLLSFAFSRLFFLMVEIALLLVFARFALGVKVIGSLVGLLGLCLVGALCFSALGLVIASRARTIEGVSGLMNFAMVPMWLGSGVFFSYERFPEWTHPVLEFIPLTALNNGLRAVSMEGLGLTSLGPELALLVGWAVVCFGVAIRIFRWQ